MGDEAAIPVTSGRLGDRLAEDLPRLVRFLADPRRRVRGLEPEDVAQEALARALRHGAGFDGRSDAWPWLRRVAVLDVVRDGFELEVQGVPLSGGRVRLLVDLRHRALHRPIPVLETPLGGRTDPVTVQLPECTLASVAGHLDLRSGEGLVLAAEDPATGSRYVVLLTVTEVEASEARAGR